MKLEARVNQQKESMNPTISPTPTREYRFPLGEVDFPQITREAMGNILLVRGSKNHVLLVRRVWAQQFEDLEKVPELLEERLSAEWGCHTVKTEKDGTFETLNYPALGNIGAHEGVGWGAYAFSLTGLPQVIRQVADAKAALVPKIEITVEVLA